MSRGLSCCGWCSRAFAVQTCTIGGATRRKAPLPPTGRVMGHEGYGVVHSLGRGAARDSLGRRLREGDRVVYTAIFPCNRCRMCLKGLGNLCVNRPFPAAGDYPYFTGTYADYLYLPPGHPIFLAPDGISDEVLAPVNCAMGTVTQGLISAGAEAGDWVVIQGAGGLGLTATAVAKDMGAHGVIVLDRLQNRLELAHEFGADYVININEYDTAEARIERVWELTRGRGADVVMELVGRAELLVEGCRDAGQRGDVRGDWGHCAGADGGVGPFDAAKGEADCRIVDVSRTLASEDPGLPGA